ncbi:MAG: prepilin-type N-terminal cleavage/methylation domain-containing protein [Bacilli bacterium]|nr:prepilin-type N-terminal cleavage/methylation domain-containing protein [Bacilli bacterium]
MNKNKKGFTLVELLAVIVILAVILIIAIPQIMNTIRSTRLRTIESSAKLIATKAEEDYLAQQTINSNYRPIGIPCSDVVKLSKDYASCRITYDSNGVAKVKLNGADGGKFANIQCTGTKDSVTCSKLEWVYAFGDITNANDGEVDFTNLKDESNNSRPVFIRYNKNNLIEKYVCTTYNMTNNEPTCISADAYYTRNDANAEWNTIKALFGESHCTETGGSTASINCQTNLWSCSSTIKMSYHGAFTNGSGCDLGNIQCGVTPVGAYCQIEPAQHSSV